MPKPKITDRRPLTADRYNNLVYGIHPVIEAIKAGRQIDKILLHSDFTPDRAPELFHLIRAYHIITQRVPQQRLDRITRKNHQGIIALIPPIEYQPLGNIVQSLFEQGQNPFLLLLDGITDVRNFGAIARTADAAAVNAIIIPEHTSVSITPDAIKTSAGALSSLPVCREHSSAAAARYLKDSGIQLIAVSEKASIPYTAPDYSLPSALVFGSEHHGINPNVLSLCHSHVAIPMHGAISSLNVSVAAAILMFEVVRQRSQL